MGDRPKLCHNYRLRSKLYEGVAGVLSLLGAKYIKFTVMFSSQKLTLLLPTAGLEAATRNFEHVLIDCDYFRVPELIPREGHTVIDGGAYLGFYTVASSLLVGTRGIVYSVEPNREILPLLGRNIELNNLKRARIYPYAICPHTGRGVLYVGLHSSVSSLMRSHVENYTTVVGAIEVKCVKLSSLITHIGYVDTLKLDIEGLELDVIREAGSKLSMVGRIVVEVHKDLVDLQEVENVLREQGYNVFIVYTSSEMADQVLLYAYRVFHKRVLKTCNLLT